jgi:hypothetical protein
MPNWLVPSKLAFWFYQCTRFVAKMAMKLAILCKESGSPTSRVSQKVVMVDVDVGSACARFHHLFVGGSDSKCAHAPRQVG